MFKKILNCLVTTSFLFNTCSASHVVEEPENRVWKLAKVALAGAALFDSSADGKTLMLTTNSTFPNIQPLSPDRFDITTSLSSNNTIYNVVGVPEDQDYFYIQFANNTTDYDLINGETKVSYKGYFDKNITTYNITGLVEESNVMSNSSSSSSSTPWYDLENIKGNLFWYFTAGIAASYVKDGMDALIKYTKCKERCKEKYAKYREKQNAKAVQIEIEKNKVSSLGNPVVRNKDIFEIPDDQNKVQQEHSSLLNVTEDVNSSQNRGGSVQNRHFQTVFEDK